MKKLHGTYRLKLLMVFSFSVLLITILVTVIMTTSSNSVLRSRLSSNLELLTEQALGNFSNTTASISRELGNQLNAQRIPELLWRMDETQASVTAQQAREISTALSRTIFHESGYDRIYLVSKSGIAFSDTFADESFIYTAGRIYQENNETTYGDTNWVRTEDGEVFLLRDLYHTSPLRYMGKVIARLRSPQVISLGEGDFSYMCSIAFLKDDQLVAVAGTVSESTLDDIRRAAASVNASLGNTLISRKKDARWQAIGILPEQAVTVQYLSAIQIGMIVCLCGILFGAIFIFALTGRISQQVHQLLGAMDEVAEGNTDTRVPVTSQDEIGQLGEHFNTMLNRNQELVRRIMQEEKQRDQARYDSLEYKYRSLHSQINPHFIFNAFEVVNAMAKLDGNTEICDVVAHISSFFRKNTVNMERRFITVHEEFASLQEYAQIFRYIYSNDLETPFTCDPLIENALIPTMILQPIVENALIHGMRADQAIVSITAASGSSGQLQITVRDNGDGMDPETVRRLLADISESAAPESTEHAGRSVSVGIRNIRDRLRLIYGDRAQFTIESSPDHGTTVRVTLPILYTEKELDAAAEL